MFLSFTWSNRTPDKFSFISHFIVYHRERAREIVGLLAAPSVLETGNIYSQWLSFLPSQILIELELSQEVNSWQGLPVALKLLRYGLWERKKCWMRPVRKTPINEKTTFITIFPKDVTIPCFWDSSAWEMNGWGWRGQEGGHRSMKRRHLQPSFQKI